MRLWSVWKSLLFIHSSIRFATFLQSSIHNQTVPLFASSQLALSSTRAEFEGSAGRLGEVSQDGWDIPLIFHDGLVRCQCIAWSMQDCTGGEGIGGVVFPIGLLEMLGQSLIGGRCFICPDLELRLA